MIYVVCMLLSITNYMLIITEHILTWHPHHTTISVSSAFIFSIFYTGSVCYLYSILGLFVLCILYWVCLVALFVVDTPSKMSPVVYGVTLLRGGGSGFAAPFWGSVCWVRAVAKDSPLSQRWEPSL